MLLSLLIRLIQGGVTPLEFLQTLVFSVLALVVAITLHEWSHAFVSYLLGDKTARQQGRMSLNPFKHMDVYGLLMLLLLGFGWARPVNVRASAFKKPRLGMALTAAAGPLMNFLIAFLCTPLLILTILHGNSALATNLYTLLTYLMLYSLSLGLFNLIPIPPLDGSKILGECLPLKYRYRYYGVERYGFILAFAVALLLNRLGVLGLIESGIIGLFERAWRPLFL